MKWLQMCILQFSEFLFLDEYDDVLCNLYKRLHWLLRCIAIAPDDNMNNNNNILISYSTKVMEWALHLKECWKQTVAIYLDINPAYSSGNFTLIKQAWRYCQSPKEKITFYYQYKSPWIYVCNRYTSVKLVLKL